MTGPAIFALVALLMFTASAFFVAGVALGRYGRIRDGRERP